MYMLYMIPSLLLSLSPSFAHLFTEDLWLFLIVYELFTVAFDYSFIAIIIAFIFKAIHASTDSKFALAICVLMDLVVLAFAAIAIFINPETAPNVLIIFAPIIIAFLMNITSFKSAK